MVDVMKYIRSLVMIIICINSVMITASERRSFHVPPLYGASAGIGFVNHGDNIRAIDKMFAFVTHKKHILMLVSGIIVLSIIVYYAYKQNTVEKVKKAALEEMHSYIKVLQKTMDACIDKLGLPVKVTSYLKKSFSKSIAEYIANIRNSFIRYIKKNKKYFISLTAVPIGMALSYPVTGGAVAMLGVVYGAIQSAREEIAEFRAETERLFAETNKNIKEGFENSDKKAQEHKEEVLAEIKNKTDELSEKIQNITTCIDQLKVDLGNKVDGMSDKINALSSELGAITFQMISLHTKIDERNEKDSQKDEQMNALFEQLEVVIQKFDTAKESFIELVSTMIKKSAKKTETEFEKVNEAISKIDGKTVEQTKVLSNIELQISGLLDKHDKDEKRFIEVLDRIQAGNLFLEEIKRKTSEQENNFKKFQKTIDDIQNKIENNKNILLQDITKSLEQCFTSLNQRISILEPKVNSIESDQKYTKEALKEILQQNKILYQQNEDLQQQLLFLKQQVSLLIEQNKKREQEERDFQENHKKENENLRKDLKRTAGQLMDQMGEMKDELKKEIKDGFKNNIKQQITFMMLPLSRNQRYRGKQRHGLKKQKRSKHNISFLNESSTQAEQEIKHLLNIQ